VIGALNTNFVPLQLNLTDTGFPPELAGLALWKRAYEAHPAFRVAFATTVVLDPSGRYPLATSGSGYAREASTSINYDPVRYLNFLNEGLERQQRLTQLLKDPAANAEALKAMRSEILQSIQAVNRR
jgi:hypothetical protein